MHLIRLRDPWEIEAADGSVRYQRWFNLPTGLAGATVRIAIDQLDPATSVLLNDEPLPALAGSRWTITDRLQPRNRIVIEITGDAPPASRPFGEVRLEIEAAGP